MNAALFTRGAIGFLGFGLLAVVCLALALSRAEPEIFALGVVAGFGLLPYRLLARPRWRRLGSALALLQSILLAVVLTYALASFRLPFRLPLLALLTVGCLIVLCSAVLSFWLSGQKKDPT